MKFEDLRILVVDDNVNMRRLINTILYSVGVREVVEVDNGADALAMIKDWKPDLLLVDYVMDGLDGVEFTRRVRSEIDSSGTRLPIIIVTGYSELWRLNEAKKAGANDFIVKPFTTKALVNRIQRTMSRDLTLTEADRQAEASPAS
ncbi:MAG TPA: response regulator [Patescibacteria group bacterium]|nr:response regulator [Patescibacteria group bacterium]